MSHHSNEERENDENETLTHDGFTTLEKVFVWLNGLSLLTILPIIFNWPFKSIEQYQQGFFFRYGKSKTGSVPLEAGLCVCLPCDNLVRIDMRQMTFDIPAQNLLTGDSVTVIVDGIVFWKVVDPWKALMDAVNYSKATARTASVCLRNVLSSKTLNEVLNDRTNIAEEICESADRHTRKWGVVGERCIVE
eukprot:GHVH01005790.1.p1 GENE.GHVH01005790.1~~GHVH01005790.1.p1  ORF type:complete len:191 (+),score=14.79 GHVH01005790.1:145-717(+)